MYCNTSLFQVNLSNESNPIVIENKYGNTMFGNHPCDSPNIKPKIRYRTVSSIILRDGFFLYFNQKNVAHSICQLIISLYEIQKLDKTPHLYISDIIADMPFLYKLIHLLFNPKQITIVQAATKYKCKNLFIPTYIWFYEDYLNEFTFDESNKVRIFKPIEKTGSKFKDHIHYFSTMIDNIYNSNKSNYKTHDNIFIIKSQVCSDSTTPQRAMMLSSEVLEILNRYSYEMILPHKINDIVEYIVVMKSAKNIITSYGGAQCTNRFFFTNGSVKVIGNKSYKNEYMDANHNAFCIFKSNYTAFFLGINDAVTTTEIEGIIQYNP